MSQLELQFLSTPKVSVEGNALSFPSRKALALLIYLVVEGGMQSRDQLAALLWPESPPHRARATLRNGLHQLRSVLPNDNFLHIKRDSIGFNFEADYVLDLELVTQASLDDTPIDTLKAALAQVHGDFLSGFSLDDAPAFDDWAGIQQTLWERRFDAMFDRLSRHYFEAGAVQEGIEIGNRWIAHNPLNEAAYQRLMRLYLAAGDRTAVQQTYQTCRTILTEELGMEPSPETKALATQLIAQNISSAPTLQASVENLKFSEGLLVGRTDEFTTLVEKYHHTVQGKPQITAVIGEAGIGKTRLADEFAAWAMAQGGTVLRGRSFESGRQIPYQTLVDALRPHLEAINAPEDYLSDIWLAELSRLLPELLERYPDLEPARLDEAAARTRLYEAIVRLMLSLAERNTPVILYLDDLQWADTASLAVLQYASRRWQESGAAILLLITARAEALHPMSTAHASQLVDCLAGLARHLPSTTLSLNPLTAVDTEKLLADFGLPQEDPFSQWLYQETSGQPFYLVETLADLREQGVIRSHTDADGVWRLQVALPGGARFQASPTANVPDKVRHMIAARLTRLDPVAFDLLVASAVLAQDFTFELLCAVADVAQGVGLRALDELLHSQLLREVKGRGETAVSASAAPYIFAHDKIRDVVYTEAGDARRRIFHRRALATLATQNSPAAQLAHHAQAAGDSEATFSYALAAGDESLRLFAAQEAITHYEQARAYSKRLSADSDSLQQLYVQLGRGYELAGSIEAALAVYGELQTIAQERADKPLELAALMARTTIYASATDHYDPEHVTVLTEQALPLAQALGDYAAEAKIQWNLMLLGIFSHNPQDALVAGEASLALAREHNLSEREAFALHDLTRVYAFVGEGEKSLQAAKGARALWRKLGNKAMLADILIGTALMAYISQSDGEKQLPHLKEALALSQEIDNLWNQSYANYILGTIYFDLGNLSQTIKCCTAAIELGFQAGFMVPLYTTGGMLALSYDLIGQPELAWPLLKEGLKKKTEMQDQVIALQEAVAFLHLCEGELAQVDAVIEETYHYFRGIETISIGLFFALPIDGRLRLARGQFEQAIEISQILINYLQETGVHLYVTDGYYIQGRALLALDRVDEALALLTQARELAERHQARRILREILLALAEVAETKGEGETAVSLRQQARDVANWMADQIDDLEWREGFLSRAGI